MAQDTWTLAPCGGVRLANDSFEIVYNDEHKRPLVDIRGKHKLTYLVKFTKSGTIKCDHTYNQIVQAYYSGERVGAEYGDRLYSLYQINGRCLFISIDYYNLDKKTEVNYLILHDNNTVEEPKPLPLMKTEPERYLKALEEEEDKWIVVNNKGEMFEILKPVLYGESFTVNLSDFDNTNPVILNELFDKAVATIENGYIVTVVNDFRGTSKWETLGMDFDSIRWDNSPLWMGKDGKLHCKFMGFLMQGQNNPSRMCTINHSAFIGEEVEITRGQVPKCMATITAFYHDAVNELKF